MKCFFGQMLFRQHNVT